MYVPVVCFTCGCPIGDVEDLFRIMRTAKVKKILESRGTITTQAAVDAGLQIDCSDILEKLFINNYCCRAHLISSMRFSDYY